MALAERTRRSLTKEEHAVDARLADALDHLLGALDGLPGNGNGDEARPQPQLYYGRGQVSYGLKERGFFSLLVPRLRYSRRLRYRILRLIAVSCAMAGAAMMLVRLLSLG
jgi:hypothetical protein